MTKQVTYTSTLANDIMAQVQRYSESNRVNKKQVIERALRKFFDDVKREEYIKSFKRAKNDPEMMELAEAGITDYLKLLDR